MVLTIPESYYVHGTLIGRGIMDCRITLKTFKARVEIYHQLSVLLQEKDVPHTSARKKEAKGKWQGQFHDSEGSAYRA